ncbi:UDP-N-acetylglucosamine-peptide N-acetylglucosaminyltransferase [Stenotrophomonas sp. MMGLT7]|uniref:UDP-N-acetylglucosamine-peptide N-acetylglucosaminyltransferase n=1 Tax=Stenotrophomonas sp. MMGLT7 TaxID=2901227 RepID=UPI001E368DDF|nr:UDP-N-acetylglucosamine-peptide N-acetylglucosaminyltransferase [Stenotrophomonas sp. MMGLT7]MCD7098077.1 UDP-N-acetylglucosamine-peptide N-acetylglucosaminyltransferase [Stenotrophomonas sp. MMGLT7]
MNDIQRHPGRFALNIAEAERILRVAAQKEPQNAEVLTCLGAVLSDAGKHPEATQVLRAAIGVGSQDRNTYFNLGVALINSADHEEAMSYFRRASGLRSSPNTWEAYFDPQAH